jgi:hypothetical protein
MKLGVGTESNFIAKDSLTGGGKIDVVVIAIEFPYINVDNLIT